MLNKALIPVAGLGTRMLPISSAVPKALLPLVDPAGRVRPVVHFVLREAAAAGARQIVLMVAPGQEETFQAYLQAARQAGDELPQEIRCVPAEPRGFGYAVACGRPFVGDEPFMVLLGDHVQRAEPGQPACAAQVAQAFRRRGGAAMIGVQPVGPDQLPLVGVTGGEPIEGRLYRCRHFIEKPSLAQARALLATPGLPADRFLAHCGIYVFTAEIFDCLQAVAAGLAPGQELQLADAQNLLLKRRGQDHALCEVAGRAWDSGSPETYAADRDALRRADD
jgi:UTP--glucose-1-phosphate uridylyltransferase